MTEVTGWLHLIAAILASWRLTELIVMDRISGPFRQRYPWYIWTCPRCVSVWAGIACTAAWVYLPWANWPLAFAWLYLVRLDWVHGLQRWREWTNTYARKPIAGGATIVAASCENKTGQLDVQAALDTAVNGDTVSIPAGTCTWTVTVNPGAKYLTLSGAGATVTNILDNIPKTSGSSSTKRAIHWSTVTGGVTRITGFSFFGTSGDSFSHGMIAFVGSSSQVRFDNNRCTEGSGANPSQILKIGEYVRGVADHNTFDRGDMTGTNNGIGVDHGTWGDTGSNGDNSWFVADTTGTSDAFYIEDNTFTSPSTVRFLADGEGGARFVVRFNTMVNHKWQPHGADSGGRDRGTRSFEVYNNTADYDSSVSNIFTGTRAGSGFVFDNVITTSGPGGVTNLFQPSVYRRTKSQQGRWGPWCGSDNHSVTSITRSGTTATLTTAAEHGLTATGFGFRVRGADQTEYNGSFGTPLAVTSTTIDYTVAGSPATPATGTILLDSPFDGNTDTTGYPCLAQSGRGQSTDSTWTTNPPPLTWPGDALTPIYVWNNTKNGVLTGSGGHPDVVVENRDIYNSVAGGGAGTGTTGIGRGVIASRPATCTTGVGYWATNEGSWRTGQADNTSGRLYKCTATDTWTLWYTPYTYPHPLNATSATAVLRLRVRP